MVKQLDCSSSPKSIGRVLERVGTDWTPQLRFFRELRENGEKILYDGRVIFSDSDRNSLLELGYNKDKLPLKQAKVVMAFSKNRFIPIFFRVIPGSIHEIGTLELLAEELGHDLILVMDKGFNSADVRKDLSERVTYLMPLKRNSSLIDYNQELESFFLWKEKPIKYTSWRRGDDFIYLYEDISLRAEEEKTYHQLLDNGKDVEFKEEEAGKITLISNQEFGPEDAYQMWKSRDQIEKAFHTLQNILDADRPWVQKEETFRGYLFGSYIGLLAYYLVLRELKEAEINSKVSVRDLLLEFSKLYKVEIGEKETLSERSKRVRELMESLGKEDLITKKMQS
ncbi:hypothetical protein AKJ65_07455 [candidate division MSBL1 archaeon SCGC-AAA259E19]|uniref:Transposase IS4-like domain-containing protein n=1 Tax=candidate division MSBL1 archaeon SCGC-AAA259E19 TaxID=1698264 RepID=A0A133UE81_9EURY|nr:hypothetical protein AKJ65_07455 [candidate division MSBL1 archaeon SCGC-AAA259E19]